MKTIVHVKTICFASIMLFAAIFAAPIKAQSPLSDAQMKGLQVTDYNKAVIIYYLKTQLGVSVGSEKPSKDHTSMEARIAVTLVKALSEKERMQCQNNLKGAGGDKNKTQQPTQDNLVACSGLNYPTMWYYLDLCTK